MLVSLKAVLCLTTALTGSAIVCPAAGTWSPAASRQIARLDSQSPDTSIVRLHISGMTCGSCPATARLALRQLAGIYSATVTLGDSLGVVQYDAARVTPSQIAAHLARLTGFGATVLPDTTHASRRPGGR
jgi:copper chaperone CopZ